MKTSKQKTATGKSAMVDTTLHVFIHPTLLASALVLGLVFAAPALAASLPVPMVPTPLLCAGCAANTPANLPFVQAGSATASTSGQVMTINQASPTAILNWQNFNIAPSYSVNFVQPSATASALNRIWDANPSKIYGTLNANGQVYLINHNGIIFGNGAQVNTGALIASSLDIQDSVYQKGYLANNNSSGVITPAFSGNSGFVRVDTGAVLNGSRIMMFAPVVENSGSITTTDGQAVLAAGHKVYLEASQDPNLRGVLVEVDVTNPGAVDANLVGQVQNNAAGTVTNFPGTKKDPAKIEALHGNVTLIGYAVNQQGRVSATTSVSQNGSIKLLARHEIASATTTANLTQSYESNSYDIRATQTGAVTLAKGSVTQVLPETTDTSTTTDGQGFNPSIVEVMGKTVNVQGSIVAPGGKVNLVAVGSISPIVGSTGQPGIGIYQEIDPTLPYSSFLNPNYKPVAVADGARVFLDKDSLIDVSGSTTASVSVARNILAVQLRGSQLADAPLQKNGFLWGKTVNIDIRKGSTLANYAGDEAQIGRTVAERTATGGQVVITSSGDAVLNPGATINLSGGQVNYTGDYVNITALISKGVAYDIANASPNLIYDAIGGMVSVTHNKWGVTESWNTLGGTNLGGANLGGTWDPGYVQGMAAGSLTILAPNAAVESKIVSNTVAGIYQRQPYADPATLTVNNYKNTWQMAPKGGALTIGYSKAVANADIYDFITNNDVAVMANAAQTNYAVGDVLSTTSPITLDAGLFSSGLSNLAVYTNGVARINTGTSLTLVPGASVMLQGGQVDMLGAINAPGGSVSLKTVKTVNPLYNLLAGAVTVNGNIATRGTWVNDSAALGLPDTSRAIIANGGNISVNSGNLLKIASGVTLDASAGGWVDQSGKAHGGNGGNISLLNGTLQAALDKITLSSYGVDSGKGGALKLFAGDVQIGGVTTAGMTFLPASFFQTGGFSSYSITALGNNVTNADGSIKQLGLNVDGLIQPRSQSLILNRDAVFKVSGTDIYALSNPGFLPDWQRNPANIILAQTGSAGTLSIGASAQIQVDPRASITLNAANQLTVLGTLNAPAGAINLNLNSTSTNYIPTQSIWLGSQSKLLAQGYFFKAQPNVQNLTQGQVLSGGKINIGTTNGGYVVAQKGSLMDVSGTSADIDLPQLQSGSLVYRTSHVAGDAGAIAIQAGEGALLDGSMNAGIEAGSSAAAGSFSLILNNDPELSNPSTNPPNPGGYWMAPPQLQVMASGNGSFAAQTFAKDAAGKDIISDEHAGLVKLDKIAGKAHLDASALQKSGFDQVKLKSDNAIVFADQVNLQTKRSITLDTPQFVVNGSSTISSAQVTLGNFDPRLPLANPVAGPVAGNNTLSVSGQMIDLSGNFAVSGANLLAFNSNGDIRLNGVFNSTSNMLSGSLRTQGNIALQADQVYPSTMAQFKLSVEDSTGAPAGKITILPGQHKPGAVMSAGGQVTLSANDILQGGVLKAPMGTINLNDKQSVTLAAGSLTSVSGEGQIVPFGLIQGGKTWVYDLTGADKFVTVATPPQKQINLSGINVAISAAQNGRPAAVVDLSGGGDLYAYEFFAGSGGSVNVLDPGKAAANTYAILPGMSGYAPYDPQYAGQYGQGASKTTLQPGSSVYLSGGVGLAAGYYTLLPASYALLPGAYRVTAVSGYGDRQPGQGVTTLIDGTQIMAGKFAVIGTGIQDARYSGFAVSPSSIVRTQSEFHDSYANSFFTAQAMTNNTQAPRLPVDAGQLIVSAIGTGATLALDGTFNAPSGAGGRGALVDLNGPGFDIVNTAGTANGLVQLTSASLNKMGAESLLIGGVRTQSANGMNIAVSADQIVVDNAGSVLSGPEIILAASNAVTVKAGSDIEGSGTVSGQPSNIAIGGATGSAAKGDGALLRVSSAPQVTVSRTNLSGTAATLTIENGATVGAQNAVLLDSSSATVVGNNAALNGQALSVAAQSIDIGTNPAPSATSLALSGSLLARALTFKDLTLHSYNDINFYGAAALGGLDAKQQHILNNLVLDTRSLNGFNNAGQTNIVDAANVTLTNKANATLTNNNTGTSAATAYGAGNLTINADQITLADGNKAIQGYDTVTLAAAKQIVAQGTSIVTLNAGDANPHNLVLQAGQITGVSKSNLTINAGNDTIAIQAVAGAAAPANDTLGAKLAIVGKSIADNGVINLPAGSVTLHATGAAAIDGVTLGSGSKTLATGASKTIVGQTAYAPAGTVSLTSDNGGVDVQSGAMVDVSGAAAGGDAGSINISAAKGTVSVAGNLKGAAAPNYVQGSFILDAASLVNASSTGGGTGNALTGLNDTLTAGGFANLRDMRIRTGNLVLDADAAGAKSFRANAQTFRLAADAGTIDVIGTVDASGANGGNILLAANGNVTLENTALLDAHASGTSTAGGKVTLETTNGAINMMAPLAVKQIDVHTDALTIISKIDGSKTESGGSVLLRAPQINGNTDVAVNVNKDVGTGNYVNAAGTSLKVSSGANVTVEAFRKYAATNIATTDVATTSAYYTDAKTFTDNNATSIKTRLGMVLTDTNMHLTPGVEIDSAGDLTLGATWDLHAWRFNDGNGNIIEPGILTLRATNNLNMGAGATVAALSDGFASADFNTAAAFTLLTTPSWSYRLVASSDTTAANVMTVAGSGSVILAPGGYKPGGTICTPRGGCHPDPNNLPSFNLEAVRTGTGTIDLAAAGGLYLGNSNAMIYTAGQLMTLPAILAANATNKAVFTTGGGDINIAVKGDISAVGLNGTGSAVNQLVSDWLWRQGSTDGTFAVQPAWWVDFGSFIQNIGALGGGNLNISAGGNITSLSAVVPSTGYVAAPGASATLLSGGNLSVKAGADINSGIFYVGNGQGTIRAGGSLGTSRVDLNGGNIKLYTILALGQGNIDVRTGGDLNLQTVVNPTILGLGSKFFTYGDSSGVALASLNGNILLSNSTGFYVAAPAYVGNLATSLLSPAASPYINPVLGKQGALTVYPGTFNATAMNGSINSNLNSGSSMILFPSSRGNLQLLAGADINFTGFLTMSDVSTSGLQANTPVSIYSDTLSVGHGVATGSQLPLHSGDTTPVSIAAGGSIIGDNTTSPIIPLLTLPKSAIVRAGTDIMNLSMSVQNVQSTDTSSMTAGRDIVFTPNAQTPSASTVGVTVSGPGQLLVQAGHNVDLGQSGGLLTNGNLGNPYLIDQGANITVLAGVGANGAGTSAFIKKYIDPATAKGYTPELAGYIAGNIDPAAKAGQANIPVMLSYFFDPTTNIGQANAAVVASFIAGNGAQPELTPAQAYAYLKTLPVSAQSSFAYNFFQAQPVQVQAGFVASGTMQGNAPDLISFVNNHGAQAGNAADAYTAFNKMSADLQSAFVNQVLFSELRQSGRSVANKGSYQAGYDAIATLFPPVYKGVPVEYKGDINLYYSQIKTMRGGSINVLTPGGGVNAGLANPSASGPQKSAAELGIVTVKGGDVNAFVNNDFMVNQSRVFTLQGGNILMWSSSGNIDAGKGSKSVSSTPPPLLVVDPKTGAFNVDVTQSVVGSGIRVLLANKNVVPGTVDLFAPSGEINAGDAGIGAAGNIFLGALRVVGADNINFGGTSVGVPVAAPAPVSVSGFGNMQDASAAAEQATQNMSNASEMAKKSLANFKPTFLSVEVIGLGDESMSLQQ